MKKQANKADVVRKYQQIVFQVSRCSVEKVKPAGAFRKDGNQQAPKATRFAFLRAFLRKDGKQRSAGSLPFQFCQKGNRITSTLAA